MEHISQGLCDLLFTTAGELRQFKRDTYKNYFMSVYEEQAEFFKDIEREYQESDDKEAFIASIADSFADKVGEKYDTLTKKSKKNTKQLQRHIL